jgi:uncharacterized membrane protein
MGGTARSIWTIVALAAILLVGSYFRFTGVNWDSNTHLHPDERFITMVETAISLPDSIGEYFDTERSPLNPYNHGYNSFVYGTFPLFLVRWLGELLGMTGYDEIHLVGRVVSGLFDLGSVVLVFLIGRRMFGVGAGLLASLLTAGAVIHIQQSHFFTFDTFVAFFLLASFFFALRLWQEERWYDYPLLGAALGLAMASKISAAAFLVVVGLVGIKRLHDASARGGNRLAEWVQVAGSFAVTGLAMLIVFRIVQPYAFTGPGFFDIGISTRFINDVGLVQRLVSGDIDQPPSVQWANTTPYLFPLRNLILWGMGLPLGLVGWAGLAFAGYRLVAKRDTKYLLIVAWVAFSFWYQGGQMAKTMRYFLPIVPLLALLGAHLLLEAWKWARGRSSSAGGWLSAGIQRGPIVLIAIVVAGTHLYGYAFTRIYTEPVTRITASEWIFQNIPPGTAIANEHWDDPLPLRWQGRDAGLYRGQMLEMYSEDTPQKRENLAAQLDETEYIFLSSNRLYGSIPRIPARYPMSTEYYRALFSGELGFEVVKTFTSYPTLFGIEINDDSAEEIFSVYDHPKVLIFQKTSEYSPQRTREILGSVSLDRVLPLKSVQAHYNGLLLSDSDRAIQQEGGTWSEMYDRGSISNRLPTISWWLALQLMGLLALPLVWAVFRRFPDRGYGLAKVVGLLAVAYLAWLFASLRLLPFGPASIGAGMVLLGLASLGVLWRRGREIRHFLVANRQMVLVHETVFLAAFLLLWVIRAWNPDLWHLHFGGEKPMEFAYLNAVAKSTFFPPYDPWLAGGYINYYYFGFVIVATVMKLTGIVPAVAFNLAVASMFALAAAGLFSLGVNFWPAMHRLESAARRWWATAAGLATAAFVLIAGNLDGAIQLIEGLWKAGGLQVRSTIPLMEGALKAAAGMLAVLSGGRLPNFDFWRSTRLVGDLESPTPIMEFPYFTFLYGDLHPHMMSMPLAALALALALAIARQGKGATNAEAPAPVSGGAGTESIELAAPAGLPASSSLARSGRAVATRRDRAATWTLGERVASIGLAGLVVGALQATNSWDFPSYLLLMCAAFLVASIVRDGELTPNGFAEALLSGLGTYVVAQLLFLPFTRNFELFYNGVEPSSAKTLVTHYLVMFGLFLFCILGVMLVLVQRNRWHRFRIRHYVENLGGTPRAARRGPLWARLVRPTAWMELLPLILLAMGGVAALAALLGLGLVSLLLLLGMVVLLLPFQRRASPEVLLLAVMIGLGAALTLTVEFVVVKGDMGRMNTVFKFYLQAWFLFGAAAALGTAWLLARWASSGGIRGWRRAWVASLAALALAALVYPVMATPAKVGARLASTPLTMDGMAYMERATFKDQGVDIILARDRAALLWIQDNVLGSPVVLEAQIPEYRWGSRVSVYTGLPTVLGWNWHQRQQRAGYARMVEERALEVKTIFESTDPAQVMELLERFEVRLIYIGDLERAYYSPEGLAKFDEMVGRGLVPIYRSNGVVIYEVERDGIPSVVRG